MADFDNTLYEHATLFYAQPVAQACGRIVAATNNVERISAVLKAAETTCRYLAIIGLSSYCARPDGSKVISHPLKNLVNKDWAFGDFTTTLKTCATTDFDHPLRNELNALLNDTNGQATAAFKELRELRNHESHNLASMNEAKATVILASGKDEENLKKILKVFSRFLCDYPLFVIERCNYKAKNSFSATRLLLMGVASEPKPEIIKINDGLESANVYLAISNGVLQLTPFLSWSLCQKKATNSLYLLHSTVEKKVAYVTVYDDEFDTKTDYDKMIALLKGEQESLKEVSLTTSQSLMSEWSEKYKQQQGLHSQPLEAVWEKLDPKQVMWYGLMLNAKTYSDKEVESEEDARQIIQQELLDGRTLLTPLEAKQLVLLLGKEEEVRKLVGRGMLDCRTFADTTVSAAGGASCEERVESSKNVVECLKEAIQFYGKSFSFDEKDKTIDYLNVKGGSADYIALRENLVNMFIHQSYDDAKTVAQIIIRPTEATFLNAGCALVDEQALNHGGRSTARNPLISRALKLIGFAEMAGSGLIKMRQKWAEAHRPSPDFRTDPDSNTFTVILDWTYVANSDNNDDLATFWKSKTGQTVNSKEAQALLMAGEKDGVTVKKLAAKLGINEDFSDYILRELAVAKRMLTLSGDHYKLKEAFQQYAAEAKNINS